jgi:hypothetical protein
MPLKRFFYHGRIFRSVCYFELSTYVYFCVYFFNLQELQLQLQISRDGFIGAKSLVRNLQSADNKNRYRGRFLISLYTFYYSRVIPSLY